MIPSERNKISPLIALIMALGMIIGTVLILSEIGKSLTQQIPPPPTPIKEQPIGEQEKTIDKLYPICVVDIQKADPKAYYKWMVTAENGVLFYSNKEWKIGEPAFYIGSESETLYQVEELNSSKIN